MTRGYGAIRDTTPILVVDDNGSSSAVARPQPRSVLSNHGASNYDPPPSYDSVRSHSRPETSRPHSASLVSADVEVTEGHNVHYHSNPAALSTPHEPQQMHVQPLLVVIETEPPRASAAPRASAPSLEASHSSMAAQEDLIQFDPPTTVQRNRDLLGSDVEIEHHVTPPLLPRPELG